MELKDRMLRYRAKHGISQTELGNRIGESLNMVWKIEAGCNLHKANKIRVEMKMDDLEKEE